VITDEAGWHEIRANLGQAVEVPISLSVKGGMVGAGCVVRDRLTHGTNSTPATFAVAVGPQSEQNPYAVELIAISQILRHLTVGSTVKL
jgi:hypothetical protein